ncbi:hypothetical protein CODIS_40900 [Candidatus Thiodiazotropha endolucinida]|uniref:Uncharacterized protein n=1 Tax=Candidatus Thiodiazotropha endolucinida TaxID=1655433 RepID=A0A7Z0VI94_9GAMM|nr:hypothetical protein CODIS_40900 [Candidatus Thiodiazotropha endolucinida]
MAALVPAVTDQLPAGLALVKHPFPLSQQNLQKVRESRQAVPLTLSDQASRVLRRGVDGHGFRGCAQNRGYDGRYQVLKRIDGYPICR